MFTEEAIAAIRVGKIPQLPLQSLSAEGFTLYQGLMRAAIVQKQDFTLVHMWNIVLESPVAAVVNGAAQFLVRCHSPVRCVWSLSIKPAWIR